MWFCPGMSSISRVALLLVLSVVADVDSVRLRLYYLSDTSYYSYGRLEMYHSNEWIPFTITGFNMQAADLACRQLGYGFASRYATVGYMGYQPATSTYSVYNVRCYSTDTSFDSCSFSTRGYFSHHNDVGLICSNSKSRLRLLSSSGFTGGSSGRLQIYINNTWGTVCDDDFGSLEAGIACRQLGFYNGQSYNSVSSLSQYSSYVSGPIWLDNLNRCSYSSRDLRNCTYRVGVNDCSHSEDIVLTCDYSVTTSTSSYDYSSGDVRLVKNGHTSSKLSSGRLEVYYRSDRNSHYSWTPMCYSGFSNYAADLACKQLGFDKSTSFNKVGNLGSDWTTDVDSITVDSITSVNCFHYSSYSDFQSCTFSPPSDACSHLSDVAIFCSNKVSTVALASGLILGFLVLCSCAFIGVTLCVVAAVAYRKKKVSRVRTVNVTENPSEMSYRMSEQASNSVSAPAVRYTPSPFTPIVLQQEGQNPRSQFNILNPSAEEEDRDSIQEGVDDQTPLMA